ncbi:sulfatase-like hydrolase/transferase [Vibrio sp. S4M6]|uniref:sulfatase-like hydrolase/transferase n=1 Tax=Vibrio sinus TaxID=2946865 RepID=UPI002029B824|nr:sulfatase-like hydrolase/transferase [Vibrio sinus]MCL9783344.1 sulfatase-like hydrolase/transferase [Vibrio sinus]
MKEFFKSYNTLVLQSRVNSWKEETINKTSSFGGVKVIVIGESVGINYMDNLNRNSNSKLYFPGVEIYKSAISPSTITDISVPMIMTYHKVLKPNYSKSLINLANDLGYKTYWISNQGYIGRYDTPITALAKQASQQTFLNRKSYIYSKNDKDVLRPFLKYLLSPYKNKLIVIHLMGSHEYACDRLTRDEYNSISSNLPYSKDLVEKCYIRSIKNTSQLLVKIVNMMRQLDVKASLFYFSDHGLVTIKNKPYLVHDRNDVPYLNSVRVPLIYWDKMSNNVIVNSDKVCLSNFSRIAAGWLGLKERKRISLGDCKYVLNSKSEPVNISKLKTETSSLGFHIL